MDSGGVGSNRLTNATRAWLDCAFLAQYKVHTDKTLGDYTTSYEEFHLHKQVWASNKSKRKESKGKEVVVNESWGIPKPHIARHAPEHIRTKGTLDNFSTELMEHLHRSHYKDPYGFTNHHKRWQKQVIRRLRRQEKIRQYEEWLTWYQEVYWREQEQAAMEIADETREQREDEPEELERRAAGDELGASAASRGERGGDGGHNGGSREVQGASLETMEVQKSLQSQSATGPAGRN
ncbi:hypothetical protein FRC11_014956 [Ceratobasidium sp. 423]|nr:hypothetical protein FRC11_014956 [Ceratobasidium sp. 423]